MALGDFLKKAGATAVAVAQVAAEKAVVVANDVAETAKEKAPGMVESLKGFAGNVQTEGQAILGKAKATIADWVAPEEEDESCKNLIALAWLLANADGKITAEEREKLAEIALGLDDTYLTYAEELEQRCAERLATSVKDFGMDAAVRIEAKFVIEKMELSPRDARLLCWNLLAIANADDLDLKEMEFIRYVAERTGVDEAVFAELCNYSNAILEVAAACAELKKSDRSYAEIEPLVNEYAERENVLVAAAQALVMDR